MITSINDIVTKASGRGRKRLVVAYAQDAHTIWAVNDAVDKGLVEATLIGDPVEIARICKEGKFEISRFKIIAERDDFKCVNMAVRMISQGEGDILMKGLVTSDKYMRGILNKEFGLVPPKGILSHIAVMKLPMYGKILLVSDVAVIPYPDLNQKTAMVKYLVSTAHALGIECPKVACIAPSEQVLGNVMSCTDAAILSKMGDRGQFGEALIDGPLALDVALFSEIVKIKKLFGSSVAGDADCLLFPSLDAANAFFKSGTQLCKADLACVVTGTTAPCVLTSRGDTYETKRNSIALACLLAK